MALAAFVTKEEGANALADDTASPRATIWFFISIQYEVLTNGANR